MLVERKFLTHILLSLTLGLCSYYLNWLELAFAAVPDANVIDALDKADRVKRDHLNRVIAVDLRHLPIDLATLETLVTLKHIRSLQLSGTDLSTRELSVIAELKSLQSLDLRGCEIDTAGFQSLQQLEKLKVLRLSGKGIATRLTPEDVSTLAGIDSLRALLLDFFPISDQAVKNITQHTQLRELGLAGTGITDSSVPALFKMPQLKKLRLANTKITGKGLAMSGPDSQIVDLDISSCPNFDERHLKHLEKSAPLSKLNLYDCRVTNQGVRHLENLSDLKWLNLDKTLITDEALRSVGKLFQLEFLHIGSTQITAGGLPQLTALKRLNRLIITETSVTDDEAKAFVGKNLSIKLQFGPKKP